MRILILLSSFFSCSVLAHSAESTAEFLQGIAHPMSGMDHLLAMLAVGVLSSRFGGATIWQIPAAFIASMLVGLYLGESGFSLPSYQLGIAFSLVLLGLFLLRPGTPSLLLILISVLVFGLFHGYAHGIEIGGLINPEGFRKGFFMGSVIIHVVGVMLGLVPRQYKGFHQVMTLSGVVYISIGLFGFYEGWV
ncbi:HupE/UreJ family protein [Vibrio superstes]|uniref:Urease accessory protein UreJ n=1 Tax=Vibrio superstes NBRC 103154 TaxID=1219062 RepID=A0A511QSZ8_9VIBR|nr:HupE/UreJ family protein [Vibrio superstes]GEM80470.1 urease accessory protein UreJ [Vibrio superstes NBRC 103154]